MGYITDGPVGAHETFVDFPLVRSAEILQDDRVEVVGQGIEGRGYHTEMRIDPHDGYRIHPHSPKRLVQVRFEEGAEPPFGEDDVVGLGLRSARTPAPPYPARRAASSCP